MLKLLVVTIPLLSVQSPDQWPTYALGPSYALAEHGCQSKEDSLTVARTYELKGAREAWKLLQTMGKRPSSNGRACMKVEGDFVFKSVPVFEAEIDAGVGEAQRLSVVRADAANGNSYWLLMRNSLFAAD
jgi:hypothetical protein